MQLVDCEVQTEEVELLLRESGGEGYTTRRAWDKRFNSLVHYHPPPKEASMRKGVKKCIYLLVFLTFLGGAGIVLIGYYCPESMCSVRSFSSVKKYKYNYIRDGINQFHLQTDVLGKPLGEAARSGTGPSFEDVISRDFQFDIEDHDVIVFLHIQKTGGTTFGKHLVSDLDLARRCECHRRVKKRCTCLRPGPNSDEMWLFSRHSTGWKCGLHADWTELTSCVDDMMDKIEDHEIKRRYFYITFLRNPVHRYLSEFRHVRRGATWKNTKLLCQGRHATKEEVPMCYETKTWENVTLEEFMECDSNLAINRQTRMLADLSLVGCYNKSMMQPEEREKAMLLSAKNNLKKMAFFGLTEFQEISQYLFEETFNLKFRVRFDQHNQTISDMALQDIDLATRRRVEEINSIDIQLYEYAKMLLQQRFKKLSSQDLSFKEHFENMGMSKFSWSEIDQEQ
ncbi:heparan-sulfate 6-O-sulfotransferase 2-like [Homarus americanus]|uniref:Heparan-sulfate 6-O-sulfotransferase n=1 Tax=Homarus americanus TaxID=6706 RepID=A0A8J5K6D4_HOMAM|nr:heparan-sulfate 6-O-sulfotransferase 2-like [Homarus americanus]KAG7168528.1 Heparan-sulfate 6-O-sulfotransferase 1-like [Homarus americanus]